MCIFPEVGREGEVTLKRGENHVEIVRIVGRVREHDAIATGCANVTGCCLRVSCLFCAASEVYLVVFGRRSEWFVLYNVAHM